MSSDNSEMNTSRSYFDSFPYIDPQTTNSGVEAEPILGGNDENKEENNKETEVIKEEKTEKPLKLEVKLRENLSEEEKKLQRLPSFLFEKEENQYRLDRYESGAEPTNLTSFFEDQPEDTSGRRFFFD